VSGVGVQFPTSRECVYQLLCLRASSRPEVAEKQVGVQLAVFAHWRNLLKDLSGLLELACKQQGLRDEISITGFGGLG
jgi:hypothetical protein